MKLELRQLAPWVFGLGQLRRYTQDSPVMPDVWTAFGEQPDGHLDLLLEPHREAGAAGLARAVNATDLTPDREEMKLAYNQSHVAAELTFEELVCGVLPLSNWWKNCLWPANEDKVDKVFEKRRGDIVAGLENPMREQGRRAMGKELPGALIWFVGIVGRIEWERRNPEREADPNEPPEGLTYDLIVDTAADLLKGLERDDGEPPKLWAVNRNRPARPAVWRSRVTVKADAATRLFSLSCRTLCWAVLDSGVDATHPAFARRDADGPLAAGGARAAADSRVRATYDFTRLRALLATKADNDISQRLLDGRPVDWTLLLPELEITAAKYDAPTHEHGTHVAGILAADWRQERPAGPRRRDLMGVCPDIELYDLRVLDDDGARRRVRDHRRAAVRPLPQRQRRRAGHPRRQPQPLAPPRRRQLRVRAHAGLRRVRAAGRRGVGRGRRGRQRGASDVLPDASGTTEGYRTASASPTPATPRG